MTRQFCDVCNTEIYGNNKMELFIGNNSKLQELDVCHKCRTKILEGRMRSDIEICNQLRKAQVKVK